MAKFIGILNNAESITEDSIEALNAIPNISMIFKAEIHDSYPGGSFKPQTFFKYTSVDHNGQKLIISVGKFDITDIRPEKPLRADLGGPIQYFKGADILVFDKEKQMTHVFKQILPVENFLLNRLLPLIKDLGRTQDWDTFLQLDSINFLNAEKAALKKQLLVKEEQLNKLRDKIKELKK